MNVTWTRHNISLCVRGIFWYSSLQKFGDCCEIAKFKQLDQHLHVFYAFRGACACNAWNVCRMIDVTPFNNFKTIFTRYLLWSTVPFLVRCLCATSGFLWWWQQSICRMKGLSRWSNQPGICWRGLVRSERKSLGGEICGPWWRRKVPRCLGNLTAKVLTSIPGELR